MKTGQQWLCAFACLLSPGQLSAALVPPSFSPAGGFVHSPALVTLTNPNPAGAIFCTFDGSDPRDPFGHVVTNGRSYSDPISVNRSMILRARVKSGTNWSEVAAAPFTADQDFSKLLFTEVMYHPRDADDLAEFVELKNVGVVPLNLSGLEFAAVYLDDPDILTAIFPFGAGTMVWPGEFLVLISNTNGFRAIHPSARIDGQYFGDLINAQERLVIRRANDALATTMAYSSHAPWQVVPDNHGYFPNDGVGFSLVRANLDPAADAEDYRTWRASTRRFGSPGEDDPEPVVPPIYINELLTRASGGLRDSVEFFNPNPTNVHIGGWLLSDERNVPSGYSIPPGTLVPASGFLVLDETQFGSGSNGIAFSAEGERCYLFSADTNGILTGYSHGFQFEASERDVSFGRHLASDGTEDFPAQLARTFGGANAGPRASPLVISEVMYHPESGQAEYVELRNTTGVPWPLWDPQFPASTWAIGTLGPFASVPTNTLIPANGHLLFVQGDTNVFRAAHAVPPEVPVFNLPFRLANGGEAIRLYSPSGVVQGNLLRYVEADKVIYNDRFPWPSGADGGGHSLERINLRGFGNDPANWRVCPTGSSPGRPNSTNLPPLVWAGGDQTNFINCLATLRGAIWDDRWAGTSLTSQWSQVNGPAPAILSSDPLASALVTFPQVGRYVLRLSATDGVFASADLTTVDVVERPFDLWRNTNFTPAELANASVSGAAADPDGDGSSNLDEYRLSTPPRLANPRPPMRVGIIDGRLQIAWTQKGGAIDVRVTPERADELGGPWFGGPGLFEQTEVVRPDGMLADRAVRELVPATNSPRRFIRLRSALAAE